MLIICEISEETVTMVSIFCSSGLFFSLALAYDDNITATSQGAPVASQANHRKGERARCSEWVKTGELLHRCGESHREGEEEKRRMRALVDGGSRVQFCSRHQPGPSSFLPETERLCERHHLEFGSDMLWQSHSGSLLSLVHDHHWQSGRSQYLLCDAT